MKKRWMGLIACLVIGQLQAASFDCAKTSTKVEKLICADDELSKLDKELARAYAGALAQAMDVATLKKEQKAWLKERNQCVDAGCLKHTYTVRLEMLPSPTTSPAPPKVSGLTNNLISLATASAQPDAHAVSTTTPGHYRMTSGKGYAVCEAYKRMLDKLGELREPLACRNNLLDKTPGISRPTWREVPFDFDLYLKLMALSASRSSGFADYHPHTAEKPFDPAKHPQFVKAHREISVRNRTRMFVAEIDTNADGRMETVMRLAHDQEKSGCPQYGLFFVNPQLTDLDETPYPNLFGTPNRYGAPVTDSTDVVIYADKAYFFKDYADEIFFLRDPYAGRLNICAFEFTQSTPGGNKK